MLEVVNSDTWESKHIASRDCPDAHSRHPGTPSEVGLVVCRERAGRCPHCATPLGPLSTAADGTEPCGIRVSATGLPKPFGSIGSIRLDAVIAMEAA